MAARSWKLTVRDGSTVERERHDTLDGALAAASRRLDELRPGARRDPTHAFLREIAPGEQVPARIELRGPGRGSGGLDLRGDGAVTAWTGRISKRIVEPEPHEDALDALSRELSR